MQWIPSDDTYSKKDARVGAYAHWWATKEKPHLPPELRLEPNTKISLRDQETQDSQGTQVAEALYTFGETVPLPTDVSHPKPDEVLEWDTSQIASKLPDFDDIDPKTVITGILDTGIALSHMRTNVEAGKTRILASWQQGAAMNRTHDGELAQPWLPCGEEIFEGRINEELRALGNDTGNVDETQFNRALKLSVPDRFLGNRDLEMAAAHGTHTLDLAAGLDHENSTPEDRARQRIIAVNLPAQYSHGSGGNFLPYFAVYGVERILHIADALWEKKFGRGEVGGVRGFPIVINFSYGMVAGPKDGNHVFEAALWRIIDARKKVAGDNNRTASPVRVFMPAGNDNLERGAASIVLGQDGVTHHLTKYPAKSEVTLPWRIKPEDSTSNFCEVWSEAQRADDFAAMIDDLKVAISPPGHNDVALPSFKDGYFYDLGKFARVYVRHVKIDHTSNEHAVHTLSVDDDAKSQFEYDTLKALTKKFERQDMYRLVLLICTAPTFLDLPRLPTAPAGDWTINAQYSGKPLDFTFYVQTDQSAVVTSKTGRRSYFDHPSYRTHATEHPNHFHEYLTDIRIPESGGPLDTYAYDMDVAPGSKGHEIDNDNWLFYGPVQRRGMHNALSTLGRSELIAVGAYDDSNGRPAPYSSTTDGNPMKPPSDETRVPTSFLNGPAPYNVGRETITVSLPGENAPSLFGLLASGARDGSIAAIRGTSMATALATRQAAQAFTRTAPAAWDKTATDDWFRVVAGHNEATAKTDHFGQPMPWPMPKIYPEGSKAKGGRLKMGDGRLSDTRRDIRPPRLGGDA